MLLLYYMAWVAGLLLHTVFYIYCYLFLGTMYMFILHFKIKLFLSFLYFQNKIHISYYCDFYSGLIQKIISPCMLKNTNFACFFCLFYSCTNTTPPIQFYLDVGGFGAIKSHAFFVA